MTTSEIKQAEPVAWRINFGNGFHSAWIDGKPSEKVLNHWLKQGRKLDFAYTHPAPAVADFSDAYQGAREDLAIWKKRALEAEELNRKFIADINGHTFMGEPVPAAAINEQARRDAERYRWLRDKSDPPHNFYLSVPIEFDGVKYTPQEVDSYIDAAIAAAEAAKKGGV